MLRKRVIPLIAIDGFSVIKTENFSVRRNLGSPVTVVNTYNTRNVDELILIDLDASKRAQMISPALVKHISKHCFMPLTVGGGVNSLEGFEALLTAGADKITINKSAYENPDLIRKAAMKFGKQCVVVSVDLIRGIDGQLKLYSQGEILEEDVWEWLENVHQLGAGEILIQSVDCDGTLAGPDFSLIKELAEKVSLPIIYSGGIGSLSDAVSALKEDISGLGITSLFQFSKVTPSDVKHEAWNNNIAVRL